MNVKPIYTFDDLDSTGVHSVPVSGMILVKDDGNGKPFIIMKKDNTGLDETSTIQDFINNTNLYSYTSDMSEINGGTY